MVLLPVAALASAGPSAALEPSPPLLPPGQREIASAGPLTRIITSNTLNCQVARFGDMSFEFFDPLLTLGSCGTAVSVGGSLLTPGSQLFAPAFGFPSLQTAFTPISQSAVTGSGTRTRPFRLETVVGLGTTGLRLTQTDYYVVGSDTYRTDLALANTSTEARNVVIYRAGDCYMGDDDFGFGQVEGRSVACSATANNSPPGRVLRWTPIGTGASNYFEGFFATVFAQVGLRTPLPDTCRCTELIDNGAAISWSLSVPAGASATRSHNLTLTGNAGAGGGGGTTPVGSRLKYLALGDSFASGEGNSPYESNRTQGEICRRSAARPPSAFDRATRLVRRVDRPQGSYPYALPGELLALVPRSVVRNLSVVAESHACTGARTADILSGQHPTVSPQVDELERNADLVSVTIGGNDAGYSGAVALCVVRADCFQPPTTREVALCQSLIGRGLQVAPFRCDENLGNAVRDRITALNPGSTTAGPLDRVYDGIDAKLAALGARRQLRFVVGYPEIFPEADEVDARDVNACRSVQARRGNLRGSLSRGEMTRLNELSRLLNSTIRLAATENGFVFVPADEALDGHELCTQEPWVRGLEGRNPASALHPTDLGQQSIAHFAAGGIYPLLDFNVTRGGGHRGEG